MTTKLDEFLEFLFGEEDGYVYAPFKRDDGVWVKHWYIWPMDSEALYIDIWDRGARGDQYLSPVLYNSSDTQDFKHSKVVWCDFDEGIPTELGDFPGPAIRIQSSTNIGKQHWYWKLRSPERDFRVLERYNRQLAYALGADRGCWNFGRVLRPPETFNNKYDPPAPVSLEEYQDGFIDEYVFSVLPSVPELSHQDFTPTSVGSWHPAVGIYKWKPKAWDFFTAPKYDGERHHALSSIAITCREMGMSRDEIYSVLDDADTRWGKYVGRSDRDERLKQIILYAESFPGTEAIEGDPGDEQLAGSKPQSFSRFVAHKFQVDWIIDGLLHSRGLGIVASPPGIGKTQFTTNLLLAIGSGKTFLGWDIERPRRVLFLSLEMTQPELKFYLDKMITEFTEEERKLIDDNCFFVSRQAFRLNSETNQAQLLSWIDDLQPEGIFIDSLSRCAGGDLEKGEVDKVFDFLNKEIRDRRGCFVWFVHHNRKANYNQQQPKKLEDLYGSQYIGAYASTVVGLWKITNTEIEVNCLKVWLSKPFKSFIIDRTPSLTFRKQRSIEY